MSGPDPLVVEVERSGLVESRHLVDVAVADADGALVAAAGDPQTVAYLRSSAKPVQALACLENGWRAPGTEQIAVACASHSAEAEHVRAVRVTLEAAGVAEGALRCPAAWPFRAEDAAGAGRPARVLHNCSGKHAAMLAASSVNGWALDDYREPDHPMQRSVRALLERMVGRSPLAEGTDGCGVPTFAFPLGDAARIFARLADHGAEALDAMTAHPFLVGGTARLCTAVMSAVSDVVVKIGAEGMACGVIRGRRTGFVLKARDGTPRARDAATVAVLRMLTGPSEPLPQALAPFADPAVIGGDRRVGSLRCRGMLSSI